MSQKLIMENWRRFSDLDHLLLLEKVDLNKVDLKKVADIAKMLTDTNLSASRRASIIRRLLPYNNLFYADWLFKGVQRSIVQ